MKKIKSFSLAITMLFYYLSYSQINKISNTDSTKVIQVKTHCASSIKSDNKPLYILDDNIISVEKFKKINSDSVAAINILKGQAATELYGSKANYGVIIIETKRYQKRK